MLFSDMQVRSRQYFLEISKIFLDQGKIFFCTDRLKRVYLFINHATKLHFKEKFHNQEDDIHVPSVYIYIYHCRLITRAAVFYRV